jgi:branched-chain amino acid transport system ATP-binding protein
MILKAEDIHTYYGDSYILQGISFEIEPGMVLGFLGRNGVGKTTLMHSLIGLVPPRRGRVTFLGRDLTGKMPYEIVRQGMAMVPQGREIFPSLNVVENLAVGHRPKEGGWDLEQVYAFFPRLAERKEHMGNKLSGGEQQMLAVGRSLMTNPKLILMDEPTEGLSPLYVQTMGEVIQKLKKGGMTIILVEQNLRFALKNADYVHIINKGGIVHSSGPEELDADTETKQKYLGV